MGDGRSCESGYVFRPPNKTRALKKRHLWNQRIVGIMSACLLTGFVLHHHSESTDLDGILPSSSRKKGSNFCPHMNLSCQIVQYDIYRVSIIIYNQCMICKCPNTEICRPGSACLESWLGSIQIHLNLVSPKSKIRIPHTLNSTRRPKIQSPKSDIQKPKSKIHNPHTPHTHILHKELLPNAKIQAKTFNFGLWILWIWGWSRWMMGMVFRPRPSYEARLESWTDIAVDHDSFCFGPKKITIAGIMEMGGMPGRPLTLNFSYVERGGACQPLAHSYGPKMTPFVECPVCMKARRYHQK